MTATLLEHQNLVELPDGPVDWLADYNALLNIIAAGRTLKLTAAVALSNGDPFYVDSNGKAAKATAYTEQVGIWQSASTAQDAVGFGQIDGLISNGSSWNEGAFVYVSTTGALTETPPVANARPIALVIEVGKLLILGGNPISLGGPWKGSVQTTDATQTAVFTRTLTEQKSYMVVARVAARQGDTNRAAYQRTACVYRASAGSATLQGSVQDDFTVESDTNWDVTIDVSSNDVRVMVTGVASTTIDWVVEVEIIEVP